MKSLAHFLKDEAAPDPNAEAGWDAVVQAMPGWFWETDAQYCLTYLSEGLERHSGLKHADLLGVCILNTRYGKAGREAGIAAYHEKLRARAPISQMIYEKILISGQRAVFLDSAVPKFDASGGFLGYRGVTFHLSQAVASAGRELGVVADLMQRADTLEAMLGQRNKDLEHSNGALTEILNAMGEGLLVTSRGEIMDPDNRILFVNPEYLRLFGFTADEIYPGRPFSEIIARLKTRGDFASSGAETIAQALPENESTKVHLPSLNRTIYVKGARRPGGGYVLMHSDITELEAHTRMLESARQAADVANQAKSNFLASMSHEIRTPMNGIVGMTDLLAQTPLTDDQRDCVETVRASALALTSLISDILDFSKIEAGRIELSLGPVDLRALCRDVTALMRSMAEAKGLALDFEVAADVPPAVSADEARLRQVAVNLIGNAIKFTLSGHVRLRLGGAAPTIMEVCDTGIGIPEDKLDRIFAPFEQAQGGLQRQFEGTGLGLAISRTLVEAMQGRIEVTSREGFGTTFRVTLPLPACAAAPVRVAAPSDPVALGDLHVLVAEDNRTNQIVVQRMLERLGARCTVVENGRDAVAAFETAGVDAVLMDLSMPKLSGLDACRLMRQIEARNDLPPRPIIALTGNAFEQDRIAAETAGMTGFLSKPLQLQTLADELARHFAGAQAQAS